MEQAHKFLPSIFQTDPESNSSCKAYTVGNDHGSFAVVYSRQALQGSVLMQCLAHEMYHLTDGIFVYIGETDIPLGSEVAAYLNDWLHGQVSKYLLKAGLLDKIPVSCNSDSRRTLK